MTRRVRKVTGGIVASLLLLWLLQLLADPSGCGTVPAEGLPDVAPVGTVSLATDASEWILREGEEPTGPFALVFCPFKTGQGVEVSCGYGEEPVVVGETYHSLEPNGEPCPGHVLEAPR